MYNNKTILAIIPARSGSKGVKDKNIRLLNGKPLIAYTIQEAIKSKIFDDVVVSTDSKKYACISEQYGAYVPFLRSKDLAKDTTTSTEVILNTLHEMKKIQKEYDYFMLLQPTSPLRSNVDIIKSVNLCFEKNANSIVSVSKTNKSPLLMNTLDESLSLEGFLNEKIIEKRRQELETFYELNGSIYFVKTDYFLEFRNIYKDKVFAYIMDQERSIDIDSELDLIVAEVIIKNLAYFNKIKT